MKIRMKEGRELFDPDMVPPKLLPHGEDIEVPDSSLWAWRAVRVGDADMVEPPKPAAEAQERPPRHSAAVPPPETTRPSGERQRGA